jgi:hypothetical protein
MRKSLRKLALSRETVRNLAAGRLAGMAAGATHTVCLYTVCDATCADTCDTCPQQSCYSCDGTC